MSPVDFSSLEKRFESISLSSHPKEDEWMDEEVKVDWDHISSHIESVIAGFLSIGKKDGWNSPEGNTWELGFRFVRYTLRKFWSKSSSRLSDYWTLAIRKKT